MSQDEAIILALKVVLIADVVSVLAFTAVYTALAKWWLNAIGRTIVIEGMLLVLLLVPSLMSLFWTFNRLTSHIAAWVDIGLFTLMAAVMFWRCAVWVKIHREKNKDAPETEGEI